MNPLMMTPSRLEELIAVVNRVNESVIEMEPDNQAALQYIVSIPRTIVPGQYFKRVDATRLLAELNAGGNWRTLVSLHTALIFQLQVNGFDYDDLVLWLDKANSTMYPANANMNFSSEDEKTVGCYLGNNIDTFMRERDLFELLTQNAWLFAYYLYAALPIQITINWNNENRKRKTAE